MFVSYSALLQALGGQGFISVTCTHGNNTISLGPGSRQVDLTCKMAVVPDWHIMCPYTRKFTHSRPHSSPCRVYSRSAFQNMFRPSSSTTVANPILSSLDVKRILFQKITERGDELKRAFQLLDTARSMTVTKSELRRVITAFLLPLTREQFQDVLAQIPLTSSGAVPYLVFLSRFGGIDLSINVIKRFAQHYDIDKDAAVDYKVFLKNLSSNNDLNLKYNTGSQEVLWENQRVKSSKREEPPSSAVSDNVWKNYSLDEIETAFCLELSKCYEKVEKALSAGDPCTSGYVSLNYLKIVLDTFVYRLPRRVFIQLMKSINFRNQVHKENIITKLFRHEDHYTSLKKALLLIKSKPDGQITGQELQRVLNCMVVNISDSEFRELMRVLDPGCTGCVSVSKFTELIEENPKLHKIPACKDTKMPLFLAWDSVEEIIHDSIAKNPSAFCNMLRSYDLGDTGLIGRNNFKKIMRVFCPFLTTEHLVKLCSKFQDIASGRILYKKLLACLGINRPPTVSPVSVPKGQLLNEQLQKEEQPLPDLSERAKPAESQGAMARNMTKEEVIEKLKSCIRQQDPALRKRFLDFTKEPDGKINMHDFKKDPYAAFFKMDTDRDGILTMYDLHRLLQHLLFNLKDEEFERLLGLLGLRLSVTLNFREFRSLCEKRSFCTDDDAPQRLLRPKQKVADSELACEQAHQYLVTKAKTRWSDLSKNFIETDSEGNGILRRRDVKNALYGFDIPLTPREFEKLWMRYDSEGRGHITYQEFLQKLGINYSADVHRPFVEEYLNFMGHFTKPQQVQEELKELQQSREKATVARDKLKDHDQDISKALAKLDKSKTGYISLCRLQKLLQECGCSLKEEELIDLLNSWGIGWHNNSINYLDFLRAVENSKPTRPQSQEKEESVPINFAALNPEEVLKNIQEVVAASSLALSMTAVEWAEKMPRGPRPLSPKEMANQELLARLHKAVTSHYHAIAQEFENFDTMKTNTASRDEFRSICTRHVQVLTDEQFDRLWEEMPVNSKGRLKYLDFLSSFNADKPATPPATGDSAKAQRGSSVPEVSDRGRSAGSSPTRDPKAGPKSRSHPCTPSSVSGTPPLQNCEPIETKLRKKVQGCWRELLRECKERDPNRQGEIPGPEFLALVEKFNLDITRDECQQLLVKYDLKNNGKFAYCSFMQSCVLLLKAKETSLMQRMKIQNANKMKEAGAETCSFYSALLRIQPKIVHCWRPMRRTFKAYDEGGTGFLSVADFRKVLRQYSINLSEEEFFHILEYYDKTLSSKISYNDFLRAFLQ
ncbi:hypothetical protein AB1E19_004571 [Capra hircus]